MIRRWRWGGAVVAVLMAAGACGGGGSALEQTEHNLAELEAAKIDLRLAATSGTGDSETGPVGFQLRGPFAFNQSHKPRSST